MTTKMCKVVTYHEGLWIPLGGNSASILFISSGQVGNFLFSFADLIQVTIETF